VVDEERVLVDNVLTLLRFVEEEMVWAQA